MFTAKVFRVMVCSLSGTMEEVFVAKDAIRKWNQENAEHAGKVYLLVEETTHQEDADVLIGVVGNWIENTDVVEDFIAARKKVLLFFNRYHDPKNTMPSEALIVAEFKRVFQAISITYEYINNDDLTLLVRNSLD